MIELIIPLAFPAIPSYLKATIASFDILPNYLLTCTVQTLKGYCNQHKFTNNFDLRILYSHTLRTASSAWCQAIRITEYHMAEERGYTSMHGRVLQALSQACANWVYV